LGVYTEEDFIEKLQLLQFYCMFLSSLTFPSDGRKLQKTIFYSTDIAKDSRITN